MGHVGHGSVHCWVRWVKKCDPLSAPKQSVCSDRDGIFLRHRRLRKQRPTGDRFRNKEQTHGDYKVVSASQLTGRTAAAGTVPLRLMMLKMRRNQLTRTRVDRTSFRHWRLRATFDVLTEVGHRLRFLAVAQRDTERRPPS